MADNSGDSVGKICQSPRYSHNQLVGMRGLDSSKPSALDR